jgi:tRNA/tmRNA/rRNA uracil-C5-methylase (TrmA/RlmC/RlmD family)
MLKNLHYDVIEEMSSISQSLARMDKYIKDSADCGSCKQVWEKIKKQHEEELATLTEELKSHVKQGNL